MPNQELKWEKKYWLVVIGLACLALAYYSINQKNVNIPLTEFLPVIGGGAYALNFLTNLAK